MRKRFVSFAALACAAVCAFSMTACEDRDRSRQLGKPVEFKAGEIENLSAFAWKADAFASSFAAEIYAAGGQTDNFCVSPVSVYSALALAAECAAGETRAEILSALGVTYEQLKANYPALYKSLNVTNENYEGEVVCTLSLGNSVWLDERLEYKQSCVDALSEFYQSYTYSADFLNDNAAANQAVRDFVKEQTKGLIDKDFRLSTDTLFTLINTLYLKTVWMNGTDLKFTADKYNFKNADDSTTSVNLLQGDYTLGRVYESENFTSFYTATMGGYKVKFILPKKGKTLDEVFTAENIAEANAVIDYRALDEKETTEYHTRCLFPEYKCKYDEDVKDILKEKFGIKLFFDKDYCDYSSMTDTFAYCSKVRHVTDLTVDKTGIEGAAVTVIESPGASAPPLHQNKKVYADFILDKAFGFVITDINNVALFSGAVNKI